MLDPHSHAVHAQEVTRRFLTEAEQERLARQLPRGPSATRLRLAALCYRLAELLDARTGDLQRQNAPSRRVSMSV